MKDITLSGVLLLSAMAFADFASAQSPVIKVDFDKSGRPTTEVTQVGFTPWIVSSSSAQMTENGITFIVSKSKESTGDRKSTRLHSSNEIPSRMPASA